MFSRMLATCAAACEEALESARGWSDRQLDIALVHALATVETAASRAFDDPDYVRLLRLTALLCGEASAACLRQEPDEVLLRCALACSWAAASCLEHSEAFDFRESDHDEPFPATGRKGLDRR
jgi:hypothetical protein